MTSLASFSTFQVPERGPERTGHGTCDLAPWSLVLGLDVELESPKKKLQNAKKTVDRRLRRGLL